MTREPARLFEDQRSERPGGGIAAATDAAYRAMRGVPERGRADDRPRGDTGDLARPRAHVYRRGMRGPMPLITS